MTKPTFHYDRYGIVDVNAAGATLNIIDHPQFFYGQMIWTSKVLSYNEESGRIETMNTIYIPYEGECV